MVLVGGRDKATALWKLPINPLGVPGQVLRTIKSIEIHLQPNQSMHHMAHNIYTLPYKQNQLKYTHQSFFGPPIATLLSAIHNSQLDDIPFTKVDLVCKYLPPSPATPKGHMKHPRAGI